MTAALHLEDRSVTILSPSEEDAASYLLLELSIPFGRDSLGALCLGREALHSRDRIVHAGGDKIGSKVTTAVREELEQRVGSSVTFLRGRALELVIRRGRACGVVFASGYGEVEVMLAPAARAVESARAIARAARRRTESRGAHFRTDYPYVDAEQARRFFVHAVHGSLQPSPPRTPGEHRPEHLP